ncbi:MAG: restriction endonuclease subunit S [Marinomonas sp.]
MSELPKGWVETHLPNVAEVIMGQSPSSLDCNDYGEGIPFFQGKTEFKSLYPQVRKYCTKPKKMAQKDDVLLSVRAPVGPTNFADRECAIGQGLAAIRGSFKSEKYVLYFFRNIEPWLSKQGTGTTFKAISGQFIKDLQIQVAPLAEQKRIVEKLDQVLAQVDTIKARLDGIPAILKRFRQSVLAAAVSGKLTGVPIVKLGELNQCASIVSGLAFKKSQYSESGSRLLQIANVGYGKTKWDSCNFIPLELAQECNEYSMADGDIVLALNRPITNDTLKVAWVESSDLPATLYQRVARIRCKERGLKSEYLFFLMQSPKFLKLVELNLKGSDQPYLNTSDLASFDIYAPSEMRQTEIVRLVDQYFAFADTIEKQVQKAQQRVDKLTQSILAKAFRGELVPQDPTDEPADELLKRIAAARAESEALAKAAKKVGKKTGKS